MIFKRFTLSVTALLFILSAYAAGSAQKNSPYAGKWDITGTDAQGNKQVYWLEIKEENGALAGSFLNRSGSVYKLTSAAVENDRVLPVRFAEGRSSFSNRIRPSCGGELMLNSSPASS